MNGHESDALAREVTACLNNIRQLYDRQFHPHAHEAMPDDAERWQRGVLNAIERTKDSVERLALAQHDAERSNAGRDAALAIGALDAQFTSIAAQIGLGQAGGQILPSTGSMLVGLINNIKAVVQGISAQILQLISTLVTPSGWAVAGGLGANLFGLQGNVQIEIQFH